MPWLTHPDLPHNPPKNVPDEDSAAVHREAGWVDWDPPKVEPTPGIVPGTEDPPAKKTKASKQTAPETGDGTEGDEK